MYKSTKNQNLLIIIFILLFVNTKSYSQSFITVVKKEFKDEKEGFKDAWKDIKEGDKYYKIETKGSYLDALDFYLSAYAYNSDNPELNYKIGTCYLNTVSKAKSLRYFLNAYKEKPEIVFDIHYVLGMAYQYNYKFKKAIKEYSIFQASIPDDFTDKYDRIIFKKIKECKSGEKLKQKPKRVFIDNLKEVNTIYPDYSPLISADESIMLLTSRQPNTTGGYTDHYDGQYYEDIYISKNKNGKWSRPKNIGSPINTDKHNATVGLSIDGQRVFIYAFGDILYSHNRGNNWTKPKSISKNINSSEIESSACFSPDENTIYFVRGRTSDDRSNGDIYVSKRKETGEWGEPHRLSDAINTPYDERGVFMHADGKSLYFSSKGHNSMGGQDIFKTVLQDNGSWSVPENLGYPINTPDDDVFFVLSASGRHGYYSSVKKGGKGFTDIYKIIFLGPEKPLISGNEDNLIASVAKPTKEVIIESKEKIKTIRLTILKGYVYDKITNKPVAAQIEIVDNEKNEIISTSSSNSKTGNYLLSLPSGKNYGIVVKQNDYLFHSENFNIAPTSSYQEIMLNIPLVSIREGSKIVLKNIFFDTGKAILKTESYSELDRVAKLLKIQVNLKVEIGGHTDNQGSYNSNFKLSQNRAKAVVDYLIGQGITSSRLSFKGYAYKEAISTNKTKEGRAQNRRVEFKIIGK